MRTQLYVISSALDALTDRQDVIANNLAHLQTTGFRREASRIDSFETVLQGTIGDERARFATQVASIDFTPGPLRPTGRKTDVALTEPHEFFVVEGAEGRAYTRAGRFSRSAGGRLVDASGHAVIGTSGAPIVAPSGELDFTAAGSVRVNGAEIGRIQVVRFDDPSVLHHGRRGVLVDPTGQGDRPVAEPKLELETLEGSNVEPMVELTRLIENSRSFESKHRVVQTLDTMNQQLLSLANGG